ncbi:MAG TPA: transposase [Chloroflexota bacterium]|nr:transposase [Chloroflexota bacterium]
MDKTVSRRRQRRLAGFDYANPSHAYFVTIRAVHGTAPFRRPEIAQSVLSSLHWLRTERQVQIQAHCVMPDHLHVLLRLPPDSPPLGRLIGAFKRLTTRQSWEHGIRGRLWQPRFYDHIVRRSEDAGEIARYIRDNPVRAGLVTDADAYPYSGFADPR